MNVAPIRHNKLREALGAVREATCLIVAVDDPAPLTTHTAELFECQFGSIQMK
jgi:hypothetical protein